MLVQIIFMKCGLLTLKQANSGCCRSSLIPFSWTKVFTPHYQASQASSFCWGTSYLMSYHTASRSISWLHGRGVTGEDIKEIILCSQNKTKYFRLRLTDEVSSDRPKKDLRPETDLGLTWDWPERKKWILWALEHFSSDRQTNGRRLAFTGLLTEPKS